MTDSYLTTPQGRKLAYRQTEARPGQPTFVWLSGFKSDMSGTKVVELEAWAQSCGHGFIAFDYSGHGLSGGEFADGTIGAWREDTLAVLDELAETTPLILVGSSMGGWMALLAAIARPDLVSGLVLIAPAPDFTEKLMWETFSDDAREAVMTEGVYMRPSDYDEPYPITRALIEDGRTWQLLDKSINFRGSVRILQGMQDVDVPCTHAEKLVELLQSDDLTFTLVKDGDHRLSRPQDIRRLIATCEDIAIGQQIDKAD